MNPVQQAFVRIARRGSATQKDFDIVFTATLRGLSNFRTRQIPNGDCEDLALRAIEAACRAVDTGDFDPNTATERGVRAYLNVSVRRRALDYLRHAKHDPGVSAVEFDEDTVPHREAQVELQANFSDLDRVAQEAVRRYPKQAGLAAAWDQWIAKAIEGVPLRKVLEDAGALAPDAPEKDFKVVRNAFYKRQQHLRETLARVIGELESEGVYDDDQARQLRAMGDAMKWLQTPAEEAPAPGASDDTTPDRLPIE